jgi:hypothetical protein
MVWSYYILLDLVGNINITQTKNELLLGKPRVSMARKQKMRRAFSEASFRVLDSRGTKYCRSENGK